jgi:geranylgeranyl reductase family protein
VACWDAIVVGAGPSGSVTAHHLAQAGRTVLLLDRAEFPRDKPCGGGLTLRAVRQLPFPVDPVVEHVVDRVEFRLRYRTSYDRGGNDPLVLMTQRRRLDHYLVGRASAAGAEFRARSRVSSVRIEADRVVVETGGERLEARALVGADGANGVTARQLGLGQLAERGVALEGNAPNHAVDAGRYAGRAVIELGTVPGGYGWVFPKGDHVNVGVGGWEQTGPAIRDHLQRLCEQHGLAERDLEGVRGHRLPLRRPDARLACGRALVVGDAAGLVDPLTGDGMYECFVSAKLAADAVAELLDGRAADLTPYETATRRRLGRLVAASWAAKKAFDRHPGLAFALTRPPVVWPVVEDLVRGEIVHPGAARGVARAPLRTLAALARLCGHQGARYLEA